MASFAPPPEMTLYYYTCDGVQDEGWGCVYRSLQNAFVSTHRRVPSMRTLIQRAHAARRRRWPSARTHLPDFEHVDKWAEPALFRAYAHTHTLRVGNIRPLFSSRDAYQYRLHSVEDLIAYIEHPRRRTHAFVIDDAISAYAIVPYGGTHYLVDPHVRTRRSVRLEYDFYSLLRSRKGWLVLEVWQPQKLAMPQTVHTTHPASW